MLSAIRRALRVTLPCVISAATLFIVEPAEANPEYPMLLSQNVPMPCVPQCTLCHATLIGGPGNELSYGIVTTWKNPEITMGSVIDGSAETLVPTLMAIRALNPPLDSDKDGIPDLTELMNGDNPDIAGTASLCGNAGPVYGCARVEPKGHVDNAAAVSSAVVLLMGIGVLRRRRSSK